MFFLHAPREHEASADIKVDSGRTNPSSLFLQLTVLIHTWLPSFSASQSPLCTRHTTQKMFVRQQRDNTNKVCYE